MHLIRLPINGNQVAVRNNFHKAAKLSGSLLTYLAYTDAFRCPVPATLLLPDQGDDATIPIEVLDPIILGYTDAGRVACWRERAVAAPAAP